MDDFARHHFELSYKVAFLEKKGDAFQSFFSEIMEKRYPNDFQRVRPWGAIGDRKNDGYWRSQHTLFQCYAPNELSAKECIAKIDEDFEGALPYWKEHFGTWVFVHNSRIGLGPEVLARLRELERDHDGIIVRQWGFEELRQRLFELDEAELAAILGPAPTRRVMLELGLDDLAPVLDQIGRLPPIPPDQLRPVPASKLEYNQLSDDASALLRAGMSKAPLVGNYFVRTPESQDRIAASFRSEYERLREGQAPDAVFVGLQKLAGGGQISTPTHQAAVLACLAYFFETCDIFEEPPSREPP
ncbi:ABC-three component system protein [Nannocystaceae bacterium ST9]